MKFDIGIDNDNNITQYIIIRYFISVIIFIGCISVSHQFVYFVSKYITFESDKYKLYQISTILQSIIRTIFIIIGILISFKISDIDTTYFLSGLGILGVVIPLSIQSPIQDFMTGILLSIFNKLSIGDYIIVENNGHRISGTIIQIDAFSTYLKDPSTNLIIDIPNSKIWANPIKSIYNSTDYKIKLKVLISHKNDVRKIEQIIKNKLMEHNKVTGIDITYTSSDSRGLFLNILASINTKEEIPTITRELYKMLKFEFQDKNVIFADGNNSVYMDVEVNNSDNLNYQDNSDKNKILNTVLVDNL